MEHLLNSSRMELLLIHPPTDYIETTMMPLGLCCLAAYMEDKGIATEILDMQVYPLPYELLKRTISQRKPKIVGVTSYSISLNKTYEVFREVKQLGEGIITIVGGVHASALPEETMRSCKFIDFLVYGEGEDTLYELVYNLINNNDTSGIHGTVVRVGDGFKFNPARELIADIDSLPFPARDKLDLKRYHPGRSQYLRLPTTTMFTTRGCPFKCAFCASHRVWGTSVRMMSAARIVKEIMHCKEEYGTIDFCFRDDTFTLSRERAMQLCNMLIDNKLDISWSCFSRVDTVDYELLQKMKEAGCFLIQYGVEAGTERSLKTICKDISLQQAQDAIFLTKKAGIETVAGFMFGIPGETREDMKQTVSFAKKLNPLWAEFRRCDPLPGSSFFEILRDTSQPLPTPRWANLRNSLTFNPGDFIREANKDSITKLYKRAYFSFYLSPCWVWQKIKMFFRNPRRQIATTWKAIPIFLKRVLLAKK